MKDFIELDSFHKKALHELGSNALDSLLLSIGENPLVGFPIKQTECIRCIPCESIRKNEDLLLTYYADSSSGLTIVIGLFNAFDEGILDKALRKLALEIK